MSINQRIFIGGTGRSGTGNMLWAMGQHPSIYGMRSETHFITDAFGLRELFDSLTSRFNPDQAFNMIADFNKRMRATYAGDPATMFYSMRLDQLFGSQNYHDALNELWSHIATEIPPSSHHHPVNALYYGAMPRFWADEEALLGHMRHFVDRLIGTLALADGKSIWAEKTPANLIHLDFLYRLFPDAYFVHVKRHPYDVVESWLRQTWAPKNVIATINLLEGIYARWEWVKNGLDLTRHRFIEVKLEDLADNAQAELDRVFSFLGLSPIKCGHFFSHERLEGKAQQLSPEVKALVDERLGRFFPLMGYETPEAVSIRQRAAS